MEILKINGLTKSYPKFMLDGVSFSVEQGAIMGFVGKNGAGKSTTLKAMLNMISHESGTVEMFGKDFFGNESELKSEIGVVLGGVDFYPKKKVGTLKKITSEFYGDKWDEEKYKKYAELFELDDSKFVDSLSSGMKVKLMLAFALSHNARLLILDEPTSGLDPVSRDDLCQLFKGLVKSGERSVLFSTHITSDLEKCATHITFIKDGKILQSLPKNEFISAYSELGNPTLEDIIVSVERGDGYDKDFD